MIRVLLFCRRTCPWQRRRGERPAECEEDYNQLCVFACNPQDLSVFVV